MVEKSKYAYRNIREASEILGLEAHVLRFWESRFDELQPMTRGGGRRFYSPDDIALIRTIQELLHGRGMTIRAASRLIKSHGVHAIDQIPAPPQSNIIEQLDKWLGQLDQLERRAQSDLQELDNMITAMTKITA